MTKRAAVLGFPIHHSLSPRLHGYWLQHYGINGLYEAIETPPEALRSALQQLAATDGFQGCNLTVPLKERVLPLLDHIDPLAAAIGAANTITYHNQQWHGTNTDAYGFIENLRQHVPTVSPYLSRCVVLGAGGAGRAVIAGLLQEGAQHITLLNRSTERAETVAHAMQQAALGSAVFDIGNWDNRQDYLSGATLLVNTTSLGMTGQPPLELALDTLPVNALVTDIVYSPLITPLLAHAQARGNKVVDGLGMLLHQAQPAFEAFYGTYPAVTPALRELVIGNP